MSGRTNMSQKQLIQGFRIGALRRCFLITCRFPVVNMYGTPCYYNLKRVLFFSSSISRSLYLSLFRARFLAYQFSFHFVNICRLLTTPTFASSDRGLTVFVSLNDNLLCYNKILMHDPRDFIMGNKNLTLSI